MSFHRSNNCDRSFITYSKGIITLFNYAGQYFDVDSLDGEAPDARLDPACAESSRVRPEEAG